jgi:hypothetical protein
MDSCRFAGRAARHASWRLHRMTTVAADRLRRADGMVITTPEAGLRIGNWLCLWLRAQFHARLEGGSDAYQLGPRWTAIPGFSGSPWWRMDR